MEHLIDPEDYFVGKRVNVTDDEYDDFEGKIIGLHKGFLVVEDECGETWIVEVKQVSCLK